RPLDSRPPADGFLAGGLPDPLRALAVLGVVADRVLLQLRAQRLARDAEQRRGARLVAVADAQRVLDRHLLQLGERPHRAGRERIARERAPGPPPPATPPHLPR